METRLLFTVGRRIALVRRVLQKRTIVALAVFSALYFLCKSWQQGGANGSRVASVGMLESLSKSVSVLPETVQFTNLTIQSRLANLPLEDYEKDFVPTVPKFLTLPPAPFTIRLCNRIFRLASAYGLARQSGRKVLLRSQHEDQSLVLLNDVFDFDAKLNPVVREGHILLNTAAHKDASLNWAVASERWPCAFDNQIRSSLINSLVDRNVELSGYLQSYRYFNHYASSIRSLFTFRAALRTAAEGYLSAVHDSIVSTTQQESTGNSTAKAAPMEKKVIFVGIHIRRGDLETPYVRKRGYRTADMAYLYNAMRFFIVHLTSGNPVVHVAFVVCSDALFWFDTKFSVDVLQKHVADAHANVGGATRTSHSLFSVHYPSRDGAAMLAVRGLKGAENHNFDFSVLAHCNHSIITVGSYSFWAAYLANGITVYYRAPFYPNTDLAIEFNQTTTGYYPPQWIPLGGDETDWDETRNTYATKDLSSSQAPHV